MFEKVLVANRGEIAVRVMRTLSEMGIGTVAVYSEVDEKALHVLCADEAVCLGPAVPAQSYLDIEKIIDAAKRTKASAIHPGYGFLSENPRFSQACLDAGITFIGPPPEAMELLASKTASRRTMAEHGVPIIPGAESANWDEDSLRGEAEKLGFPVLLKAAGGGGGKGMRTVRAASELLDAYSAAQREAQAAFGDGTIYMEKLLAAPRHVEFQVLLDTQGNGVHLGERECSIQRRHQKIVEESPCTVLDPELRAAMGETAVRAARAAGYVNAGTVEFLLDADRRFYFLEINARLQVEHPITEAVTGIDIVRKQVEIASGRPLGLRQEEIRPRGHAIECRIYAEDPAANFLPCPGTILALTEPVGPGIRVDSGIYAGYTVPIEYDPILAKVIAYGENREVARRRMISALSGYAALGIKTPVSYLRAILEHEEFIRGNTDTGFLPRYFADWKPPDKLALEALVLAVLAPRVRPAAAIQAPSPDRSQFPSPFQTLGHWRLGET